MLLACSLSYLAEFKVLRLSFEVWSRQRMKLKAKNTLQFEYRSMVTLHNAQISTYYEMRCIPKYSEMSIGGTGVHKSAR